MTEALEELQNDPELARGEQRLTNKCRGQEGCSGGEGGGAQREDAMAKVQA